MLAEAFRTNLSWGVHALLHSAQSKQRRNVANGSSCCHPQGYAHRCGDDVLAQCFEKANQASGLDGSDRGALLKVTVAVREGGTTAEQLCHLPASMNKVSKWSSSKGAHR